MGEGLSHWSSMVLRKSQTYFFDRHTHPNSIYSNFCHVLNHDISNYEIVYLQKKQKSEVINNNILTFNCTISICFLFL